MFVCFYEVYYLLESIEMVRTRCAEVHRNSSYPLRRSTLNGIAVLHSGFRFQWNQSGVCGVTLL